MTSSGSEGPHQLLVLGKISAILDSFTLSRPVLSLGEIRASTGLPGSTVQRLVANLVSAGFLDRTDDRYRTGVRMSYWAASATQDMDVIEIAKPVLTELRDATGETVGFFRASEGLRVCVALAETRHVVRRAMRVGQVMPLHVGSSGRVILAYSPELARQILTGDLRPLTKGTITDEESLSVAVAQAREDGYAVTRGEREVGSSGVSAPVFNAQADLVGALSVMGPSVRLTDAVLSGLVEPTVEKAEQLTRMMGGRHPGQQ